MFCLLRVQKDCLAFAPLLPNDISQLCLRGVSYLGAKMDWLVRAQEVCIILREQEDAKPCPLQVILKSSGTKIPLIPGNTKCNAKMLMFMKHASLMKYLLVLHSSLHLWKLCMTVSQAG